MKLSFVLLTIALISESVSADCPIVPGRIQPPCEDDVESPEIIVTPSPTGLPSSSPTGPPTFSPTDAPTPSPTSGPTFLPTSKPTFSPTSSPTSLPTPAHSGSPTPAPTLAPSPVPSSTPTVPPSESPTDSPTSSPTLYPTLLPSATPSASPTFAPTISPSFPPSPIPTLIDSGSPTNAPTGSPTGAPSMLPTSMPSDAPSLSPSVGECQTEGGVFGDISSESVTIVEFGYELEANATFDMIETEIIPALEKAIADSILSQLFAECGSTRNLRVSRRLEVTGVSQNPEDLILDDVVCGEYEEGNTCVVVAGEMSLYATEDSSVATLEESMQASIKQDMESGDFDDIDPSVVRITYVELQTDSDRGNDGLEGNDDTTIGDDQNNVLIGLLVTAGVLMAAVLAVAYRRRANSEQDENTALVDGQTSVAS